MCFECTFYLIKDGVQSVGASSWKERCRPCFHFRTLSPTPYKSQFTINMEGETHFFKEQLERTITNWELKLTTKMSIPNGQGMESSIQSMDVLLEGEILKQLQATLCWGDSDQALDITINMELSPDICQPLMFLSFTDEEDEGTEDARTPTMSFRDIQLQPETDPLDPQHRHCFYQALGITAGLPVKLRAKFWRITRWNLRSLDVVISQQSCSCEISERLPVFRTGRISLKEHLGEENVEIVTEVGTGDAKEFVIMRCHDSVLIESSPVIKRMLVPTHFVEGRTKRINMTGRTKRQVDAFLDFIYKKGIRSAVQDAETNLALWEMADYYDIPYLLDKMHQVIMKRPITLIPAPVAMRMFVFADLKDDQAMLIKAGEALTLCNERELDTELFHELFPSTSAKKMLLFFQKRVSLL